MVITMKELKINKTTIIIAILSLLLMISLVYIGYNIGYKQVYLTGFTNGYNKCILEVNEKINQNQGEING